MAADSDHMARQVTPQTAPHEAARAGHAPERQHHPIGMYLKVWGYLFVLSALSYMVDYFQLEGVLRWALILTFMVLKAGLIVSIFMHMAWERLALIYAILLPPLCLGTLVLLMAIESDYTFWTRVLFFSKGG